MNGWFLAFVIVQMVSLGLYLGKHGQEKEGKYNFWAAAVSSTITVIIVYQAIKFGI